MAFICAECHAKTKCQHHSPPFYFVGVYPQVMAWDGIKVWLPTDPNGETVLGVSIGPCEDCKKARPCVNC
jgi:hypothetical protein